MSAPFSSQYGSTDSLSSDNLVPALRAVAWVCIVLSTAFTAVRLIAKKSYSRFHIEDYMSIASWLLSVAYFLVAIAESYYSLGKHMWQLEPDKMVVGTKLGYAIEIIYSFVVGVTKAALLFQLQRIFCPNKTGLVFIMAQTLLWLNTLAYLACLIVIIVQCIPIRKIWDRDAPGYCINFYDSLLASGGLNIASDVLLLILPVWAIYHLKMPLKKKMAASAMFATGALSLVCSIFRQVYSIQMIYKDDMMYELGKVILSAFGEITSIIICTCFPLVPRFVKLVSSKFEPAQSKEFSGSDTTSAPSQQMKFGYRAGQSSPQKMSNVSERELMDSHSETSSNHRRDNSNSV